MNRKRKVLFYLVFPKREFNMLDENAVMENIVNPILNSNKSWKCCDLLLDFKRYGQKTRTKTFEKMLEICRSGEVDFVYSRSIYMFDINFYSTLNSVKMLADLNHPTGIYFEREKIFSLSEEGREMIKFHERLYELEKDDGY